MLFPWSVNDPTGTMSGSTYYPGKAGTWTITGTTTNGKAGIAMVIVKPGAFVNLKIMLPATVTTNTAFTVTVTLSDSKGNLYSGVINITNTTKSITPAMEGKNDQIKDTQSTINSLAMYTYDYSPDLLVYCHQAAQTDSKIDRD